MEDVYCQGLFIKLFRMLNNARNKSKLSNFQTQIAFMKQESIASRVDLYALF